MSDDDITDMIRKLRAAGLRHLPAGLNAGDDPAITRDLIALWRQELAHYPTELLLKVTRAYVRNARDFPALSEVIRSCQRLNERLAPALEEGSEPSPEERKRLIAGLRATLAESHGPLFAGIAQDV